MYRTAGVYKVMRARIQPGDYFKLCRLAVAQRLRPSARGQGQADSVDNRRSRLAGESGVSGDILVTDNRVRQQAGSYSKQHYCLYDFRKLPIRPMACSRSSTRGSVTTRKWSGHGQLNAVP
jgi:hypothetical protein